MVSLIGHVAVLLCFFGFGGRGGELLSGDGLGDASTMEVSLVGSRPAAVSTQAPVSDPAAELLARLGAEQGGETARQAQTAPPPPSDAPRASLDELLEDTAKSARGAADGRADATAVRAQTGVKGATGRQAGGAQQAQGSASGQGGLWAVIEPCWRRQNVPAMAHARLLVDLDLLGRLASPPQVQRTGEMRLDRNQMIAEARAFEALTACLPAARGRFSGSHVLDFQRG